MLAKAILPWFGGAPAVWTTCLLFFQSLLLAGYAYAHLGRRLGPRRQAVVHVALLALSLLALPVLPSDAWKPADGDQPALRILGLLTGTVGAPFLLLASTAPLLQDWYARRPTAGAHYRLYAWSNAGSLLALLAYPLVVEPWLALDAQAWAWSAAYLVFVAGSGWLALGSRAAAAASLAATTEPSLATTPPAPAEAAPTATDRALWFAFTACGSGLLLAITNQLTLDIAVVPLLLVAPLALYLGSFIVAFAGGYRAAFWRPAYVVGAFVMALHANLGLLVALHWQAAAALATLVAACMVCHGELARRAPGPGHATAFYLTLAAGGAVGGLLVAVVAPLVLTEAWELPGFLLLPLVLLVIQFLLDPRSRGRTPARALAVIGLALVVLAGVRAFMAPSQRRRGTEVAATRSFYGTLRVVDVDRGLPTASRRLKHGRIEHGAQALDPAQRRIATGYFAADSGVELAFRHHPRRVAGQPLRIGVIGLGAGTLAAWGGAGDTMRFFELDPDVAAHARRHFTYLGDSAAAVDVIVGDGRLALERELRGPPPARGYDVLVVDAFLGGAIPVHLLTRECAALYLRALAADGVLAIHVSNRNLDLVPVVLGLAELTGWPAVRVRRHAGGAGQESTWMLLTANPAYLELRSSPAATVDRPTGAPVRWTDRHSSLLGLLRLP